MALAAFGASVVGLEGLLRGLVALVPSTRHVIAPLERHFGVAHPYIGHLHTPNGTFTVTGKDFAVVHRNDPRGFRNPWPWPEQADIVVLGDSVTFGYGVEDGDAWPARVARALPGVRLVNLGLNGAGPQQYLRVFDTFGRALAPRLVLVGFLARNDFLDAGLFDRWLRSGVGGNYMAWRDGGRPEKPGAEPRWTGVTGWAVYWLRRQSYVVNVARQAWSAGRQRLGRKEVYTFADGSRVLLLVDDFERTVAGARPDRPEFHLAVAALRDLRALAREGGARTVVVLLPSKEEVYLPLLGRPVADPTAALREALAREGIEHVDLGPVFRARAGRRLFFEEDGHPNAEGQALIAEGVLRHLESRGHLAALGEGGRR